MRFSARWNFSFLSACVALGVSGVSPMPANADEKEPYPATLPASDLRAAHAPYTLDTHRPFPSYKTIAEWEARRKQLRNQILVSCGLYPLPAKTPLRARIFDRVERDGYTIEKVYFQTYPGFYLAGNLYRPRPKPDEPNKKYPGVLVAHGHWGNGRMADQPEGSISARAITFARQGYVAFTYDMIGYNDTRQVDHRFANTPRHWLWGVSVMGIQTWNSVRALDFLISLSDVDKSRLAITGESGGGTQTMILGAIDSRLAATAPCVMVSHTMQGGCICENAPNLRQDFYNVEVAAAAAPNPQIIVGATGDWTATTMTHEGPSLAKIYTLFGKPDNEKHVIFNYGHNINKTSREAVYAFFGKHLLGDLDESKFKEPPYKMEPVEALRVFPDNKPLPLDAKTAPEMTTYLMELGQKQLEERKPTDAASLTRFQSFYKTAWERTFSLEIPKQKSLLVGNASRDAVATGRRIGLNIGRSERGDNIPALLFLPPHAGGKTPVVVLTSPHGKQAFLETGTQNPGALANSLLAKGYGVFLPDLFLTGERRDAQALAQRQRPFGAYFSVYNRTNLQERVQDLVTSIAYLRSRRDVGQVVLWGTEGAGLWSVFAAPSADAVVADGNRANLMTDDLLLEEDMFVPGLRRLGDIRATLTLAAPRPALIHNAGVAFGGTDWVADVYRAVGSQDALRVESAPLSQAEILNWLQARR